MQKVLVTGGAGFIGCHLVERLLRDGHEVIIVDNLKRPSETRLHPLLASDRLTLVQADVRQPETLAGPMRGCTLVYHLAAQSNVMGAFQDPGYSIETNVLGTHNVLQG